MVKTISQEKHISTRIPNAIGYLGLIPFVISSLAIWVSAYRELAYESLAIYASIILTFIGAVHWGFSSSTSQENKSNARLIFSITPALVSWLALLTVYEYVLPIFAICFALFWLIERYNFAEILPLWYIKLRSRLSFIVVGFLLLGWLGAIQ